MQRQLEYEPRIDSSKIGVSADEAGVVTLSGSTQTYAEKVEAEQTAKRVAGVRGIANEINVKLAGTVIRDDESIAKRALSSINWRTSIPDDRVKVTVSKGWVTLEGDVEHYYQKQDAERVVNSLTGVLGVSNRLEVKGGIAADVEKVKDEIEDALVRNAQVDATGISVRATDDSTVILERTVRNWDEFEEAEDAAWAAPGVFNVENRLRISAL